MRISLASEKLGREAGAHATSSGERENRLGPSPLGRQRGVRGSHWPLPPQLLSPRAQDNGQRGGCRGRRPGGRTESLLQARPVSGQLPLLYLGDANRHQRSSDEAAEAAFLPGDGVSGAATGRETTARPPPHLEPGRTAGDALSWR